MPDIFGRIRRLGVDLVFTNELPETYVGCYIDEERRIYVRRGLTHPVEQETLHHEFIHALHRDTSRHPAIEWRAWREAARIIVDPTEYALAERLSLDSAFIARELGTTRRIIEAYRKAITRGEIRLAA